ncbi:murein biosynthesis integral membrane protein MurJ [Hirschia litorea]|uniref:Probable lipid II flippase MurJ n=1 Tax=Hirschia litorea TaxID=1199156 RepID=A0ABW2IMM5_9PROT
MSLARNVFVQSTLTFGSRILGFIRDAVIFAKLGAGPLTDAFLTAQQFPNLFRRLLAEGAFAQAFVPLYSKSQVEEGDEAATQMATETMSMLFTVTIALSVVAQLAMPWIMLVLQAGYRDDPTIFNLSILLTQITMPYLVGMALSALFAGVLNAGGRFVLSAAAPTLMNICLLIAAFSFNDPRTVAIACSVATLIAGVLQAGVLWMGARRLGVHLKMRWPRITPAVKNVAKIAVPGALAASATQINIIVSSSIASFEAGAKGWLASADRFYQLPLGIVGVAVGVAILPRLSRAMSSAGSQTDTHRTLDEGIALAMALTLPAAVALGLIPFFLIDALFGRGQFDANDSAMAAQALIHYAWGVPAFVLVKVLAPAFFARQDTKRPMQFAVIAVIVNTVFGASAFFWLRNNGLPGFPGLAIATSFAAWLNVIMLWTTLIKRGDYKPSGLLLSRVMRVLVACSLLGAYLYVANMYREVVQFYLWDSRVMALAAIVVVGGILYGILALMTGAVSPREIQNMMRRGKS